jgi:Transcriptional regulators
MVTSKDIAFAAGVSRGTVDRVLHNRGNVSPAKEKKIRELAQQMGYRPDTAGKVLAAKKKQFKIGFCYLDSAFQCAICQGAKAYVHNLEQYGITVEFFAVNEFKHIRNEEWLQNFIQTTRHIDGWIFAGTTTKYILDGLNSYGISDKPIVFCGADLLPIENKIGFVGCDYFQSGRLACGLAAIATQEKGKVCIISIGDELIDSCTMRIKGLEQEIQDSYPQMEIVGKYFSQKFPDYSAFESYVLGEIEALPAIDILYVVNPGDYSICKSLFPLEETKKFQIITNDLVLEEEREWIHEKKLLGIICQSPEFQGQKSLEIMFDYLVLGKNPAQPWHKADLSVLIRENV